VCSQTEPSLVLELQGGFFLTRDDVPWELPLSAQRVLAFLAMQERPLLRVYIAGTLWPGSSERHAAASLRTALWRVHDGPASPLAVSGTRLGRRRADSACDARSRAPAVGPQSDAARTWRARLVATPVRVSVPFSMP
jgi:hypothetical protein